MSTFPKEFVPTGRLGDDLATFREIKVVKPDERAIISDRKAQILQRIGAIQSEVGRMNKLLNELRADVLHLTTE